MPEVLPAVGGEGETVDTEMRSSWKGVRVAWSLHFVAGC